MAVVRRVVAPNPGPYTGPGTNTWLIDAGTVTVVIDPGPDDDAHLAAIDRALKGSTVSVVLVTHSHSDHLPLAERFASKHRASVRRFPELADGDVVRAGNVNITALHTPGHSADHLAFWVPADHSLFTGDLVLGRGSSMVTYPEGDVAAYLRSPNPSTVLLLLADDTLEASHWLLKAVPAAAIVSALPPAGRQLASWLKARAQADGFDVEEDAAALLVELSGEDLTQLLGEVEKAALAGGPENRRVGVTEVRAVVGEHRLHGIFELTRALARRDAAAALALLESLLNGGEDPLGVLAMLAREARAAWQAAEALRRGRAPEDVARALRRPPAAAAALVERAQALAPAAGARLLRRCWEVERRLKLGGVPRSELSLLIADLCAA